MVPYSTKSFTASVLALRAGDAVITVTDRLTGKSLDFTVKVVSSTVLVLPNKPDLQLNEQTTFSVTPLQGTFPQNREIIWTVKEGLLKRKSSPGAGSTNLVTTNETEVYYEAPNRSVADSIKVQVLDADSGLIVGVGGTDINVGAPFRINPNGSVVPSGGFQPLTVEALGSATLPTGGSYKWSVTGGGSLSSLSTSVPTVDYTAPTGQADPNISVEILNSDGAKVGSTSSRIKVRPGNFRFTATNINSFVTGEIVNGDYNGPLVQIGQGIVGSVYRIGLVFGITEGPGVKPDMAAWVVQIAISQGSKLQAGQTFPQGPVFNPGVFYASSVLTPASGTLKILTATQNVDGTYTYTYSMTLDAYLNNGGDQAKVIDGTGSFTLAY